MFLSRDEVERLTGKKRRPSQVKALNTMGITHKVRPDGEVLVLSSHVENVLDGTKAIPKEQRPDWSSMDA